MKNISLLILSLIFLIACQNKNEIQEEQKLNYEQVGKLHNEALDYVLEKIKSQPQTKTNTRKISVGQTLGMVDEFLIQKGFTSYYTTKTTISKTDCMIDLTTKQKKYYDMIMFAFSQSSDMDVSQAISYIIEIENEIRKECSEEEQIPLLCGTAVARYTIVYWSDNLYKWKVAVLGNKSMTKSNDWSWQNFGGADVSGAVSGAVGGAMAGALVGGVGAGPAALVGGLNGGAGNSAGYAAEVFWDWLWE